MSVNFRKHIKKYQMRASYTVEAAFIMPIAFLLIILSVSYTFICYDRTAMRAWLHETAMKEGFQKRIEENENIRSVIPSMTSTMSLKLLKNRKTLKVICDGNSHFFTPLISVFFFLEEPQMEVQENVELLYGEQIIRAKGVYTDGDAL